MTAPVPDDPGRHTGAATPWEPMRCDETSVGHLLAVAGLHGPPYTRDTRGPEPGQGGDAGRDAYTTGLDAGPLVPPTLLVAQRVSSDQLGIPDAPAKLNGGNSFRWLADVAPGEQLERRSTVTDVTTKHGSSGRLDLYRIRTEYRRAAGGEPVGEADSTTIRRYPHEAGAASAEDSGGASRRPRRPVRPPENAVELFAVTPTSRDLVRYSAATQDFYEAHYDVDFARAAGLPGVLVHGLLKMAWLATAAVRYGGPGTRVGYLSATYRGIDLVGRRFRVLAAPGEPVDRPGGGTAVRLSLYGLSEDGSVSTTGEAEIEPPHTPAGTPHGDDAERPPARDPAD